MKTSFNQIMLASLVLDLALATACLRSAERFSNRRRARSGNTSGVPTPPLRTDPSESNIPTTRGE